MVREESGKVKQLVKNVISVGFVQIANYLLPLVSIPIIVRIIGPEHFGVINYYTSFIAYFVLLVNYGFDYTGTRFIAVDRHDVLRRNRHFTKILYAKGLLFVLSCILFLSTIFFVANNEEEIKIGIYSYLICIAWVISPNWFYQGMQNLTKLALFNFIVKIIYTISILLLVKKQEDYVWQPITLSVTQILISLISLIIAVRIYKIKFASVSVKDVLNLIWEDRMVFLTLVSTNLYTDTNIVILGFFESKEHVGYFSAAWKFTYIFLMIISFPLSQTLFPYIAEAFSKNVQKGIQLVQKIMPIVVYFTICCSLFAFIFGGYFIKLFYGDKFVSSILVFRILTIVPVLSYINTLLCLQTMVVLKMDKALLKIIFFCGVISVFLNLIMIHFFGYVGSAFSWIITEMFIALLSYYSLKRSGYDMFSPYYFNIFNAVNEIKGLGRQFMSKKRTSSNL
ncbi:flippase [Mucilaginibacter sp. PAMB04168]|uniref:flippase n=1 Tax=Mucilaginibacter sp. PAMB04168 TaxID=3138567 RepID=UPI0031F6B3B6